MVSVILACLLAQDLVTQDDNVISWKSIQDKGEAFEIVTTQGKKVTVKKSDVKEIKVVLPSLTGATFTAPEPIKVPPIDLLKMVDPKKDKVQGSWELEGSSLKTKHEGVFQQLQLPFAPAEEYDLKLIVERKGLQSFHTLLPIGGKKALPVVIHTGANESGIFPIDGSTHQNPGKNETAVNRPVFEAGKLCTLLFMVRKTRVVVEADGKPLIDWKIDTSRLGTDQEWKLKRQDTIGIGAWCDFLVHKVEITGAGRPVH